MSKADEISNKMGGARMPGFDLRSNVEHPPARMDETPPPRAAVSAAAGEGPQAREAVPNVPAPHPVAPPKKGIVVGLPEFDPTEERRSKTVEMRPSLLHQIKGIALIEHCKEWEVMERMAIEYAKRHYKDYIVRQ